jgi:hypothetical protein
MKTADALIGDLEELLESYPTDVAELVEWVARARAALQPTVLLLSGRVAQSSGLGAAILTAAESRLLQQGVEPSRLRNDVEILTLTVSKTQQGVYVDARLGVRP